jgi:hypothetical protein
MKIIAPKAEMRRPTLRPAVSAYRQIACFMAAMVAVVFAVSTVEPAQAQTCPQLHQCLVTCADSILYGASNDELDGCTGDCLSSASQCESGVVPPASEVAGALACSTLHQCLVTCADAVLHGATDDDLFGCQDQCKDEGAACAVEPAASAGTMTCWYGDNYDFTSTAEGDRTGAVGGTGVVGQAVQFGFPGPYMWALVVDAEPCPDRLAEDLIVASSPDASPQAGPATEAYLAYHQALTRSSTLQDVLPYMDASAQQELDAIPEEQQGQLLGFLQDVVADTTGFTLMSEEIDGSQATVTAVVCLFESLSMVTVTLVLEDGTWKFQHEASSDADLTVAMPDDPQSFIPASCS